MFDLNTLTPVLVILVGVASWYAGHRGISGVSNDISNIKADIDAVKTKLNI